MSNASKTRVPHKQHEVRHECNMNDTSATWVKMFGYNNDTSEDTFSHPYISYMANEILRGEEQFHSKNYF